MLSKKIPWEEFVSQYIEGGWFDFEDRTKTTKAMQLFWERVPVRWLNRLPQAIVFAPSPHKWGESFPWFSPVSTKESLGAFIYLSPELESLSQQKVNSTVAHEFAHIMLGHHDSSATDGDESKESEADLLISKWGYRPTNSCGWMQRGKKRRPTKCSRPTAGI
jgi:hypothetical protein